jgi:hypothetical protein
LKLLQVNRRRQAAGTAGDCVSFAGTKNRQSSFKARQICVLPRELKAIVSCATRRQKSSPPSPGPYTVLRLSSYRWLLMVIAIIGLWE